MDLVITILGWIALGVISAYLLAIVGKIIFDAATADYKLYKHVRLCRKRLLRLKAMRLTKKWESRKIRNDVNKILEKNPFKPRDLQRSALRLMRYGCSKA